MVELLSPAGSFDSFLGAINAGADAVYLGGERYSARAYADNLTQEQIIKALDIAHFYGRKVYLTLNTLLKDAEVEQAAASIEPLYEHHLDGVIVQDLGLASLLAGMYPDLPLHASTQMTVTGCNGAALLKEKGFSRLVPARELHLDEIAEIKHTVDMELECFIHGAMCYAYSGQCLFSSILGGRSGNRGRCAQPCRLPYAVYLQDMHIKDGEEYPLSMKDLCTIHMLPELIEAGIDSFKIEGRMKNSAYTCGVTALYRKYIDLYEAHGRESCRVSKEDMEQLLKLYIRSDIHDGYYHRHNGKKMITPGKPSYSGSDERLMQELTNRYVKMPPRHPVSMQICLREACAVSLAVCDRELEIEVSGDVPERASNRPLTEEDIKRQLQKTGNSLLLCEKADVQLQGDLYLSVGALNRLRRQAVCAFEEEKRRSKGFGARTMERDAEALHADEAGVSHADPGVCEKRADNPLAGARQLHVSAMSLAQLEVLADAHIDRLYVDADLWCRDMAGTSDAIKKHAGKGTEVYLALPYIARKGDAVYYENLFDLVSETDDVKGLLVRNLEQVYLARRWKQKLAGRPLRCVGDAGIYQMNCFAADFTDGLLDEYTLPYELNYGELKKLCDRAAKKGRRMTQTVYGRIPMMLSANCIKKTKDRCDRNTVLSDGQYLEDRYRKKFPVYNNCDHCYNVVYNSVPYALHNKIDQISQMQACAYRMDFVTEDPEETLRIYESFYGALLQDRPVTYAPEAFTTGHFSRGIE